MRATHRYPELQDVIEATIAATWKAPRARACRPQPSKRTIETSVAEHLLDSGRWRGGLG